MRTRWTAAAGLLVGFGLIVWWAARPVGTPSRDVAVRPPRDETARLGTAPLVLQHAIEHRTERRIRDLLATVVGPEHVVVRVAATLEPARLDRTEESVDPERAALRAQHLRREEGGAREDRSRYDVSKVISHTVAPAGVVKQLSVAVLVDDATREVDGQSVRVAATPEELDRLRALVASAIGFSEARGDRIEMASVPFAVPSNGARAGGWPRALRVAVLVLLVGTLLVGVRRATRRARPPAGVAAAPATIDVARLARDNEALAREHPERAARLVREWLRGAEAS